MRKTARFIALALIAAPALASAQQVTTRTALNGILGTSTTEGFESFPISFGNAAGVGNNTLNAAASTYFGTGMVTPGITFSTGTSLQVSGPGWFGMTSNTLLSNSGTLSIYFAQFTQAFGLDATTFSGYGTPYSVSVYDMGNAMVGSMSFGATTAPSADFVGWQNASGISRVDIGQTGYGWSESIDEVQWGTTVTSAPEPASLALMATGLVGIVGVARRRRKVADIVR